MNKSIKKYFKLILLKWKKRQKRYPDKNGYPNWNLKEQSENYLEDLINHFEEEINEYKENLEEVLELITLKDRKHCNKEVLRGQVEEKIDSLYDEAVDVGLMAFIVADRLRHESFVNEKTKI
jgi:hypothetical protein